MNLKKILLYALPTVTVVTALYISTRYISARKEERSSPPQITAPIVYQPMQAINLAIAKNDPTKRQAYLDQLIAAMQLAYCNGVVYDHNGSKILEYTKQDLLRQHVDTQTIDFVLIQRTEELQQAPYLAVTPHSHFTRGNGEFGTIFIGRYLFERPIYQNDDDFKATIAHEARHLVQHAEGLPLDYLLGDIKQLYEQSALRLDNFQRVGEMDAYAFVLEGMIAGKFHVSQEYQSMVRNRYTTMREEIVQQILQTKSQIEKMFLTAALERYKAL